MDKYQKVIMDYAKNRVSLRIINKKISDLFTNEEGEYKHIDLSGFREWWFENTDCYGQSPQWEGWVQAVEVDEYEPIQLELAKLLDEKKKINAEAGQLKRNICAYGRALLNQTNEYGEQ